MKRIIRLVGAILLFAAFNIITPSVSNSYAIYAADTAPSEFTTAFTEVAPTELTDNIFKLVGEDFTVITAGAFPQSNSMTASWGGFGILFNQPTAWAFLRANRFTLEKIKETGTFTLSYFPPENKNDVLFFGSKTGRNTDKMQESKLTPLSTPSGLPTYQEARLIFECKLAEVTKVAPDNFLTDEGKKFVEDGYADAGDYHQLIFGEIVKVWKRK